MSTSIPLPLLFVRYAPGSAGNLLITLLQTSNQLSSWNPYLDTIKNHSDFEQRYFDWFSQHFVNDLDNHLLYEPHHPYQLSFVSSKFPRGDDFTTSEFIQKLNNLNDVELIKNISNNTTSVLRLCKGVIPQWGQGAPVVNIVIDSKSSKWIHRVRWKKLFGKEGSKFISKENHPEFLKAKFSKILFNNTYQFDMPWIKFARDYVINEPVMQLFRDPSALIQDVSNQKSTQHWINLSDLLTADTALETVTRLFKELNLGQPNIDLLSTCYNHYYKYNIQPLRVKIQE